MKKSLIALLFSVLCAIGRADGPPLLPDEVPPPLPVDQADAELPPPLPGKEATSDQPTPLPPSGESVMEEESAIQAPPVTATPEALLDTALNHCGQSFGWAANWPFVDLGAGCTVQHPVNWPARWAQFQNGSVLWVDGPEAGYFHIQMLVPGNYTTAESQVPLAAQVARTRFPDLRVTNVKEASLPQGITGRMLYAYFRFDYNGKAAVGALELPFFGCSPWSSPCFQLVHGIWSTVDRLDANACTLKAIYSTFHCPHGGSGSCDDDDCNRKCRGRGYREGMCEDDVCSCVGESY